MNIEQRNMMRFARQHTPAIEAIPTENGSVAVAAYVWGETAQTLDDWSKSWTEVFSLDELKTWAGV